MAINQSKLIKLIQFFHNIMLHKDIVKILCTKFVPSKLQKSQRDKIKTLMEILVEKHRIVPRGFISTFKAR